MEECICGSTEFLITEKLVFKADLVEGKLRAYKNTFDDVEMIECIKCGSEYEERLFKEISIPSLLTKKKK